MPRSTGSSGKRSRLVPMAYSLFALQPSGSSQTRNMSNQWLEKNIRELPKETDRKCHLPRLLTSSKGKIMAMHLWIANFMVLLLAAQCCFPTKRLKMGSYPCLLFASKSSCHRDRFPIWHKELAITCALESKSQAKEARAFK